MSSEYRIVTDRQAVLISRTKSRLRAIHAVLDDTLKDCEEIGSIEMGNPSGMSRYTLDIMQACTLLKSI